MIEEGKELVERLRNEYNEIGAFQYCDLVFNSRYRTSHKTKQACLRFLKLLLNQEGERFQFNKEEAIRVDKFSRRVRLKKKREFFRPALYQTFILQQLAFIDESGIRKYRKMYISMGRKQGKSYLVAIILLYDFLLGRIPEVNKEIILTSRSESQATIIYNMISDMLRGLMELGARGIDGELLSETVQLKKSGIVNTTTGGKIEFYSSEADSVDGTEPDIGVIDEFAYMKNGRDMMAAISTGQNNIPHGLLIMVSTVSSDLNSEMYREYGLVGNILDGTHQNDRYFIFVAELEDISEWKDEENWSKANPLLIQEDLREDSIESIKQSMSDDMAKGNPLDKILVKVFNVWGKTSEEKYLDYLLWEEAVQEDFNRNGKRVYIGIDLSERSDLTGVSFIFEESSYLYVDTHAFVAGRLHDKGGDYITIKGSADQFDYTTAEEEGHITICENLISYKEVWDYIMDYVEEYDLEVAGLYFDPRMISKFNSFRPQRASRIPLIYVKQGYEELTLPIMEFKDSLIDGRIKHSDNSFMNYCVKNAETVEARNGRLIKKPSDSLRIDSLDATITAFVDLVDYNFEDDVGSSYENFLSDLRSGNFSF